jgi:nucleotide-binding universal stress UspA family protein
MHTDERETPDSAAAATFRRILVPVSLREPSHRAIHVAVELRRRFGGRVCAFHAVHSDENDHFLAGIGSPTTRSDVLEEGNAELRQFVREVEPAEADAIECSATMEDDYVAAIRAKASEWDATLLVLSPESHPALRRTHSEKLMKSLAVPVLVLEPAPPAPKPARTK